MFGPSGDPDEKSGPKEYTLVPWEEVKRASIIASPIVEPQAHPGGLREPTIPPTYTFTDQSTNACKSPNEPHAWVRLAELEPIKTS